MKESETVEKGGGFLNIGEEDCERFWGLGAEGHLTGKAPLPLIKCLDQSSVASDRSS